MEGSQSITISCHCGTARQKLAPRGAGDPFADVSFCHCDACRHTTGQLYTSYIPISSSPPPNVSSLQPHTTGPRESRYFCPTCGCHVFRLRRPSDDHAEGEWEVATGVIIDAPESDVTVPQLSKGWRHRHIQDTRDGGLSIWMPDAPRPPVIHSSPPPPPAPATSSNNNQRLLAACHCGLVRLLITRPSPSLAQNPDSPFPDLLLPYCRTSPSVVSNPSKEKWYLREVPADPSRSSSTANSGREHRYRYLAGTCACATCRLTSGFELQSWAFIPLQNILISPPHPHPSSSTSDPPVLVPVPLDFSSPPATHCLGSYHSSPSPSPSTSSDNGNGNGSSSSNNGVVRNFCLRCGATVFWHDAHRPLLIDVSAGLLRGGDEHDDGSGGASRAENWLEWWTGRVSFSEEAGTGRAGAAKSWGERFVRAVEAKMMGSREREEQ